MTTERPKCYNVITNSMSAIFQAKIRHIGNSVGVIIPGEVITEEGVVSGDIVSVSIHFSPLKERQDLLRGIIGLHEGSPGFERDREDRY